MLLESAMYINDFRGRVVVSALMDFSLVFAVAAVYEHDVFLHSSPLLSIDVFVWLCLQDKKPVGILCLPEYQSCHKADNKESKKPNSFVLDRGLVSYVGYLKSKLLSALLVVLCSIIACYHTVHYKM